MWTIGLRQSLFRRNRFRKNGKRQAKTETFFKKRLRKKVDGLLFWSYSVEKKKSPRTGKKLKPKKGDENEK